MMDSARRCGAGLRHHVRHADLAHALVGHADDGDLRDRRVRQHDVLDLGRVAVEPAHDEHVLDAVGDAQVAALVHHADVAGVQPAVGVDRFGGGGWIIEVAFHHVVAAHHDFAGLAAWHLGAGLVDAAHFDVGDRPSGGVGDGLGIILGAAHGDHARGFGEPVAGDDRLDVQFVAHAVDQLDRNDGGAGDHQAQAREIVLAAFGVGQDRLVQRRRPRQHADALVGDALQDDRRRRTPGAAGWCSRA